MGRIRSGVGEQTLPEQISDGSPGPRRCGSICLPARQRPRWRVRRAPPARLVAPAVALVSTSAHGQAVAHTALGACPNGRGGIVLRRAPHARRGREGGPCRGLRTEVAKAPVAGTREVLVSRQMGQPARIACVTVRFLALTLRPPDAFRDEWPAVPVWAVAVREETPPAGVADPLDWLLLTTVAVLTPADALERVDWYICRSRHRGGA